MYTGEEDGEEKESERCGEMRKVFNVNSQEDIR